VRRFFTAGWLGLHAVAVVLIGLFLALGWWQLQRAGAGNMRSWAYVFEWPMFSVFVVAMWIKMVHDELTGVTTGGTARGETATGAPAGGAAPPVVEEEDDELAAYNRYLARLDDETRPAGGA
jgi:DNA-binding transcriptional regulator of glucitol operon